MSHLKIFVKFSKKEREILSKPLVGSGGFQCLIRKLQRKLTPAGIELDTEEISHIYKYATKHGQGGYQERLSLFKPVVDTLTDLCVRIHTENF